MHSDSAIIFRDWPSGRDPIPQFDIERQGYLGGNLSIWRHE
jgi:hypothetical protein